MFSRRTIVKGLGGAPLAVVLADPLIARAVAGTLDTVTLARPDGKKVSAALALPDASTAPAVLLIHEWWGLNDQIKAVAAELAKEGYIALAVDLYDGNVAATPEDARRYMSAVDAADATATLAAWMGWLRAHAKGNGKLATLGWCFGGAWSLNASLAAPADATVIYYGRVPDSAATLAALKGPVMGHFAGKDKFITADKMVPAFQAALAAAGKESSIHIYPDSDHAFANPTGARYDAGDAATAWRRTLAFLNANLR